MRVLMTADTVGGVWTYALQLLEALHAQDADFHAALATMGRPLNDDQWNAVHRLSYVEVFESDYRLEWMQNPWHHVDLAGRWLQRIAASYRPDMIHLNGYAHGTLDWDAPVVMVGHSCVASWWEAVKGSALPPRWHHYHLAVRNGLRAADAVVAPTGAMGAALKRLHGLVQPVTIIPNARSADDFVPAAPEPFVFAAGRLWDEAKNLRALDIAAADLPWPVRIAGAAEHPEGGSITARHAELLGSLGGAALRDQLSRAAIYALPAKYEPFGLSVLEAALSGCALVLGDIPSLRENWEGAAAFVDPDDANALREAIQNLINDPVRREQLATLARERALQFAPERQATAYRRLYEDVTARRNDRDAARGRATSRRAGRTARTKKISPIGGHACAS